MQILRIGKLKQTQTIYTNHMQARNVDIASLKLFQNANFYNLCLWSSRVKRLAMLYRIAENEISSFHLEFSPTFQPPSNF